MKQTPPWENTPDDQVRAGVPGSRAAGRPVPADPPSTPRAAKAGAFCISELGGQQCSKGNPRAQSTP